MLLQFQKINKNSDLITQNMEYSVHNTNKNSNLITQKMEYWVHNTNKKLQFNNTKMYQYWVLIQTKIQI